MMVNSDSEDLDISLFSEKFKKAKKHLKKKNNKQQSSHNVNKLDNATHMLYSVPGSLDEEVTHDKRVKVKDKTLKRKHSSGSFSEPVSLSSANRKAKTFMNNDHRGEKLFSQSSGHIDEKKMPEGQNKEVKKRRKNIDKQGLVNKRETEEDSNKFQNFKGTSSDESDSGTSTEQSICTTQKFTKVKANKVKTKHRDDTIKQSEKTTEKKNKMLSTKRHKPETVTFDTSESDSDQVNLESVSQQVKDNSCSDEMEPEDSLDEGEMESISNETQPVSQKLEKIFSDEKGKADSEENEEMDDEYAAIKKELANIPLEDLVKIKEKLGLKIFRKIMQGRNSEDSGKKRVFKRENKNRPMEMSSKRPVSVLRQMAVPKKKVLRDPRFDDLSGEYKEEYFDRNYSFLQDVKAKEKEVIRKKLVKTKNEAKKQKLLFLLNRMNQQEQAAKQKQRQKELETTLKQKEKELIREGKTPYFLKKAERRKLELAEKYKELQKSGKMDQYLSRKRKKNAQKEKKKLPEKHTRI